MKSKSKFCKNCGVEITDAKAKNCTSCGAKISTPVYKKWWFWVIIVLSVAIIGSVGSTETDDAGSDATKDNTIVTDNKDNTASTPKKEDTTKYEVVDIQTMFDELETNALKAQNTYKGKYVEITGKIKSFDSSGYYITIESTSADEWNILDTVQCYIKNDTQRSFLMEKSVGDTVTIKGKITDVGEFLGYSMKIDEIN